MAKRSKTLPPDDGGPEYRRNSESVDELLANLEFSPESVVTAACEQPKFFVQAVEYRMLTYGAATRARMAFDSGEAARALDLRHQARISGDKMTEGNLKELLLTDEAVMELDRLQHAAEEEEEWAKLLVEAFRMRRDCLKIVGELVGQEQATRQYYENSADKMTRAREDLKRKYPGQR
jgi:hypothetical protein